MDSDKYLSALKIDPSDPAALRALGEKASASGNWREFDDYLQREADVCENAGEKADLLFRKARVNHDSLANPEGALKDIRAALKANPRMRAAIETEWRILAELGRWQELAASIETEADRLKSNNPKHAAGLHLVRADILEFRLNDPAGAEAACEQARTIVGDSDVSALRLACIPAFEIRSFEGRWAELSDVAHILESTASSFNERAAYSLLRAHLLEYRLGRPDEAEAVLAELISSCPQESIPPWLGGAAFSYSELISLSPEKDYSQALTYLLALLEADQKAPPAPWRAALMQRAGEAQEARPNGAAAALEQYRGAHERASLDPRHLRAMMRLQRGGDQEDLLKSRAAIAGVEGGPSLSAAHQLFMARTLDLGLNRIEEALAAYLKAYEFGMQSGADGQAGTPLHEHYMEALAEALRRLWNWQELETLRAEQIAATTDNKLKAALLAERSIILQHRLDSPDKAAEVYKQALALPATALGMVRGLAQCHADVGDRENLARAIAGQEKLVQDAGYLIHLGLRAGDLWLRLGRDDEAFKTLSSVVKSDGHNLEALLMLEEIMYSKKSFQNLYGIQQRIIEALDKVEDSAMRRAVSLDQAILLLRGFRNEPAALQTLKLVLEFNPGDPAALFELRSNAYQGARWEEYFDWIGQEADSAGRHTAILWRKALAAWGCMNDTSAASELLSEIFTGAGPSVPLLTISNILHFIEGKWTPWLDSAGQIDPLLDNAGRVTLYYEMGRVQRYRLQVAEAAAGCYSQMVEIEPGNYTAHEALCILNLETDNVGGLRKYHAAMAQLAADPVERATHEFSGAELAMRAGAIMDAETDWRAALKDAPDDIATLRRLERLYAETGNGRAQIEILRREITLRGDPRMLVLLLLRQGVLWEKDGKPEEAITSYREAIAHNASELEALDGLTRLYRQQQMWNELQDNLQTHAAVTPDPARKIELLTERAKVWEERLNDVQPAIASHLAALDVNPKHIPSLKELERLYMVVQSWEDELGILQRLLDLAAEREERHRIHFKMGTIYEEKMTAPSAAIASFVKAHEIEPEHLRTLDALERLYDKAGEAAKLVPILEEKAVLLPEERVRLYMWIGRLWDESLSDPAAAIASYERIISINATNLEALSALESLYERTSQWENLIGTVSMKASAIGDPAKAVELLSRAGSLWIEKFGDDEKAAAEYTKALAINPRHRPSLAKSREILSRMGKWEEVVGLYAREVEFTSEPKSKATLFTRMAEVLENKINSAPRAAQNYEMALRSDPNFLEAVRPLARIYFNNRRWEQADPLYKKWVDSIKPDDVPADVARVYYERARVFQNLSHDKEALEFYRRSIEMQPEYLDALRGRSELHLQRQEWPDALEAEGQVLKVLEKLNDTAEMGISLGKLGGYAEKVGKPEEAIRYYTRAAEVAGDTAEILENLIRLFSLKNLFNNVAGLYDRLIAIRLGKPEEASAHLRKGEVLEDKIGDKQRALAEYSRAIEIAPKYADALQRRASVLIKMFKWDEAAESAKRLFDIETEPHRLADAHCLLGRIEQEGHKNLPVARAAYEKALQVLPTHLGAMDNIGTILEAMEDWTGYVQAFEKFLKNIPQSSLERIRDIHIRLGQVQRDRLKNRDRAIIEFNNAVKADAECEPAHEALAKLYLQDKNTYPQAIRENNLLLKGNAFLVEPYQDLSKIFEEQREIDRAFCVHSILDLFNALGKWDKTNYEARLGHLPPNSTKAIDDETHERALIHPMARQPATVLLEGLGAALCKILHAGPRTGNPAPSTHSARKKAVEIAANLGVTEFEVYLDEGAKPGVSWFPGSPLAFVINPSQYDALSERGKRFMIGRGIEGIRNGAASIWGLTEAEVRKRLQLIVKLFKAEVVAAGVNEKDAVTITKALKKEVPRKVRKAIEDAASNHYTQERQFSFEAWRTGLVHSANRGGLIVCGHPGDSARGLLVIEDRIKGAETPTMQILQANEQVAEMLRFSVSDLHFVARKRTGFSLY